MADETNHISNPETGPVNNEPTQSIGVGSLSPEESNKIETDRSIEDMRTEIEEIQASGPPFPPGYREAQKAAEAAAEQRQLGESEGKSV